MSSRRAELPLEALESASRRKRENAVTFIAQLSCRECGRAYEVAPLHVCEWCFGPLEAAYDYDAIRASVTREKIAAGPPSIWRYADLLPADRGSAVDLGAGFTPLVRAERLAGALGLGELWIKNDTLNPTNSFKDRVVAFETAEQLGWRFPDHVVVPIASGSQLTKIHKGFEELAKVGLIDAEPSVRVSGAQALGCSPVAAAFLSGSDTIKPVKPDTIAKSLAIGNPADGYFALDVVRQSGGGVAAVTDAELVDGLHP